jgi:hydroxyacylglutathione hydrolase
MTTVVPIPAFTDNYIWCLHDSRDAWAVDPGDAAPLERFLGDNGLTLRGLLITHHHPDHIGGIAQLAASRPDLPVYGPDNPRIAGITHPLYDGDLIDVLDYHFRVLEVPGHTLDHIAFVDERADAPLLLCGDTLFAAGCGRLFEGTPAQMFASLQRFAVLPPATRVCCTHEYTQSNLRFACAVEPDNAVIADRARQAVALRAAGLPTLPTTIGLELATNPFLRCAEPAVIAAARTQVPEAGSGTEILAAIRAWKDRF